MRRLLTLVCLLGLALPAGISISGCVRNPAGNYCNGLGYGPKDTDVNSITLQPQVAGISLAYGQTLQVQSPSAFTCKGTPASLSSALTNYATSNNQLVDISPSGQICAGTWNRNTGGGIANYTYCNYPDPLPNTGGLPYAVAYITATAYSVTSNPVAVYIHAPISAVSLVTTSLTTSTPQQCYSQGQQALLDAQACYFNNGNQYEFCAPPSVTSLATGFKCIGGAVPLPNIVASAAFNGPYAGPITNGSILGSLYLSGGTITGTSGQTCKVSNFNSGSTGATATLQLTASNAVAEGTALIMISGGTGATAPPTTATLSNGTATCSGTIQLGQIYGSAGQNCYLTSFNNGSSGATATLTLSGPNTIGAISVTSGGTGATAPPTLALLSNGTANCSGAASVTTTLTPVPSCDASIGTLNYSVSNSNVATISPVALGSPQSTITAEQPGTTSITATIAQSASSAGYFSTCPPASIKVASATGATKDIVVTQGFTQNLTTTVLDTLGNPISGLNLSYQSTNLIDITASGGGAITAAFPGVASVYATCEPQGCNPAPINEFGLNGTGLPLSSNPVSITVPGATSDFVWFAAPGQSQYFASLELLTGSPGSTARLPFVPNSLVMDQEGNNLFFGSARELMIYSTANNSLTKQDTSVPGIVLAVSPNGNQLIINDQFRGLFYLYNPSGSGSSTYGGMGAAAAWTPDSNTVYIVDNAQLNSPASCATPLITGHTDTLYVYNVNVGWSTYPLPPNPLPLAALPTCATQPDAPISTTVQALALTVPGIGAYLAGNPTVAHTWCPSGTVGANSTIQFYPQSDSVNLLTNVLGATSDGAHMLGASVSGSSITLDDIGLAISAIPLCPEATTGTPPNQVETLTPLSTNPTINGQVNLTGVTDAIAVNQVVTGTAPTTASTTSTGTPVTPAPIAFVTYTTPSTSTTAVQLPYYLPQASGIGPAGYVKFADNSSATPPTAPLTGVFSPDNNTFFVSTAGDNEIHFISIPTNVSTTSPPTDSQQYSPALPACTPLSAGGNDAGCLFPVAPGANTVVPATVITVKPRSVT